MLVDTHCHLNLPKYFPDPDRAVAEALEVGVEKLVVVGIDLESSRLAVELAERHEGVYATVGFHPTDTANFSAEWLAPIEDLAQHPKCVAIGEIGLDYHWDTSSPQDQDAALYAQLDLAEKLGLPVVYHCRDAYKALLDRLEVRQFGGRQLFHCFVGDEQDARRAMALDCYFGVDGPITFKNAHELRATVAGLPQDRIVLETDSPFLTPAPHRGKPNAPKYVPYIAQGLSTLLGIEMSVTCRITSGNAAIFFGWTKLT